MNEIKLSDFLVMLAFVCKEFKFCPPTNFDLDWFTPHC